MKRILLYLLFLMGFSPPIAATHIVGGELNYRCLGGQDYEISLTIYRDCYNGSPNAFFDDPASIGVFDIRDSLVKSIGINGQLLIDFIEDDTIQAGLFGVCEVEPPNVCVHTTTYRDTINLPFLEGGYQLSYQRCCRNRTIQNIIEPLKTGATYYNYISENALESCNSSAVFNDWPPIYICAGEPINFDHSATDPDGDFLVYELCTPLTGANQAIPRPQPPNPPPYSDVVWNDPPYSEADMLGGIPLEINSSTGLLTGTPEQLGQFVVGVCVKEYRNGVLISTSRRDFQYNVGFCGETVAAFNSIDVQCGSLRVGFKNESSYAQLYEWIIGDINSPLLTSNEKEIWFYDFPAFGTYDVRLIASNTSGSCIDTLYKQIQLLPQTIVPSMDLEQIACGDTALISIKNTSFDPNGEIIGCEWLLSDGQELNGAKDTSILVTDIPFRAFLTVESSTGCKASVLKDIRPLILNVPIADTIAMCEGSFLQLNPFGDPSLIYNWVPSDGLSAANISNPTLTLTEGSRDFTVYFGTAGGKCNDSLNIHVYVPPPFDFELVQEGDTCSQMITLSIESNNELESVAWFDDEDFLFEISDQFDLETMVIGEKTFYVQATDIHGCVKNDSTKVIGRAIGFEIESYDWLCLGTSFNIGVRPIQNIEGATFEWSPFDVVVEGQGTPNVLVDSPMAQWLYVSTENAFGCTFADSIWISPKEDYDLPLDIVAMPDSIYPGDSAQLIATDDPDYTYAWERDSTLSVLDIHNPMATTTVPRTYYLDIIDENGCRARDSISLFLRAFECELPYIFVPNAFTPNADGNNDVFYVRGNAVDEFHLMVYNRWGQKVFETRDLDTGWDGTFKGKALAPDVFGYYLKLTCFDGRSVVKKGNVTLLR